MTIQSEAFLDLEIALAGKVRAAVEKDIRRLVRRVNTLIRQGAMADANLAVSRFSLTETGAALRKYATTIARASFFLGVSRLVEPKKSPLLKAPPLEKLDRIVAQFETGLREGVAEAIREYAHVALSQIEADVSAGVLGSGIEKRPEEVKGLGLTGVGVDIPSDPKYYGYTFNPLAAELPAVTDPFLTAISSLVVSRANTFGFIEQALINNVTRYRVNEILDAKICPVCRVMDGKTFDLQQAASRALEIMATDDPEALKSIAPWPSQKKADVERLAQMSEAELVAEGYVMPPFHPRCRGYLDVYEVEQEQEQEPEQGSGALGAALAGLTEGGIEGVTGLEVDLDLLAPKPEPQSWWGAFTEGLTSDIARLTDLFGKRDKSPVSKKYNAEQPRHPKGHPQGGHWRPMAPGESTEGEFKEFDSVRAANHWGLAYYEEPIREMTPEQEKAVLTFKGSKSAKINQALRAIPHDQYRNLDKLDISTVFFDAEGLLQNLDTVIEKQPLPESVTLWRAGSVKIFETTPRSWLESLFGEEPPIEVGTEIIDQGYVSTSLSRDVARRFKNGRERLFKIKAPKGTPAAFIDKVYGLRRPHIYGNHTELPPSIFEGDEAEILLSRGTRFRVSDVNDEYVTLDIVGIEKSEDEYQQAPRVKDARRWHWQQGDVVVFPASPVLKYEPDQPHHPKGHPAGGQWRDSDLPMEAASRKERARAQGFNTEKVYYHGTNAPDEIHAFDPQHKDSAELLKSDPAQSITPQKTPLGILRDYLRGN